MAAAPGQSSQQGRIPPPAISQDLLFFPHAEASLSFLDPEEFALVTMIQFKVSHSLNLTAEDERDRTVSSKVLYDDAMYP